MEEKLDFAGRRPTRVAGRFGCRFSVSYPAADRIPLVVPEIPEKRYFSARVATHYLAWHRHSSITPLSAAAKAVNSHDSSKMNGAARPALCSSPPLSLSLSLSLCLLFSNSQSENPNRAAWRPICLRMYRCTVIREHISLPLLRDSLLSG